jgi:hypothetical protein
MSTRSHHPQFTYRVAGMTCDHWTIAVAESVAAVDLGLETKLVQVRGSDVQPAAVLAAIDRDAVTA